ncbi:alpha/beta fold hydrolase [Micromonospora sp. 15K316]|uniref:alpha/beta fold hydrolase n=1 Tax=Micromonospora sp. 15K316 TaxID=2530376 RepID=UPI001053EE1F|nr:alpha/beta fold hydrolase [Micromonospora sp. 15K316]TDC29682.1 alpha/beta fold hydrolase [Micromonospora sp. 15K316]
MSLELAQQNTPARRTVAGRIGITLGALLALVVLAVTVLYAWPLGGSELQRATPKAFTFDAATSAAEQVVAAEAADPAVRPECRSVVMSHGTKTAKAVLLLHGYTDCPKQYASLAKRYFDEGYNVWVPRAPRHGVTDELAHAKLEAGELVSYANDSLNLVTGLGDEVGVVGISGGGVLATWLAGRRPDAVRHLLVLSPFYKPNSAQAPGFVVKPTIVLFGFHLLPDKINSAGFSFAALSQYLRIARNFDLDRRNPRLMSVAVVTSANDDFIDRQEAVGVARRIATSSDRTLAVHELPKELGVGHDIVDPEALGGNADELDSIYVDLYEGTRKD